jgi:RNA polymerase sigma-70 factor (ECF subfamily)
MKPVTKERAVWLGRHVFPHEAALRVWLTRRPLAGALETDDVVQETYAILASRESVEHIRDPRSYMFEVAKSVVLQALRRSRVVTIDALAEVEVLHVPSDLPGPEQIAADRQELHRLEALIAALPPRCRETFVLRKVRGLSQREAAEMLGLAESTVEKHMVKALLMLAQAIGRGGKPAIASSSTGNAHNVSTRHHAGGRDRA